MLPIDILQPISDFLLMVNSNRVAVLVTVCEIFSRIEVENRRFIRWFWDIPLYIRSGGTPSNINVIYKLLKSTFSELKFRRWQCGSIFIRLAVVASQICEIARNSEKIRTYSSSKSSKVIDLGANRQRRTTGNGKIVAQNGYIVIFGCRSLSQSPVKTLVEFAVVQNPRLAVEISIPTVVVSEMKIFPVLAATLPFPVSVVEAIAWGHSSSSLWSKDFYRAMHVVLAQYCYRKSSVRPSVCPSVCNVDVPRAYRLD